MNAPGRVDAFIARITEIGSRRERDEDWTLYESFKHSALRDFPNTSPQDWERLMVAIAKAAGV